MKLFICRKMDGTRDHHVKQIKSNSDRQVVHVFSHVESRGKDMKVEGKPVGRSIEGDK
jgi:hypothetical protein